MRKEELKVNLYKDKNERFKELNMKGAFIKRLMENLILGFSFLLLPLLSYTKLPLSQEKALIGEPLSFLVDEKGYIFLLDRKMRNIKIYTPKGELFKVFGRKGAGPNEFLTPVVFSKKGNLLVIFDLKREKLFFYELSGNYQFHYLKEVPFNALVFSMEILRNGRILFSGHSFSRKNVVSYSVFEFDPDKLTYKFILPSRIAYQAKDENTFDREFVEKIRILDPQNFMAECGGEIYFSTALDLKIFKIKNGKLTKIFGKASAFFIKPRVSKEMLKLVQRREWEKLEEYKRKMSFVKGLSCEGNRVGLVFSSFNEHGKDLYLQIYDSKGNFLMERKLPSLSSKDPNPEVLTFYSNKTLYLLTGTSQNEFYLEKIKLKW